MKKPGARESMVIHTRRREVRARGPHQREYAQAMRSKDLTFGIGPAGTGKTYMAVAAAVEALDTDKVRRLVLVRPAVEAGERLGFLPGDMSQKVDPYLRPMYDALYEMMGFERVARLIERHVIEIAPLAFMRGRTLNESFVILDEAQNTTVEQMKMLLTRIGYGSRAVVTGDVTQTDLPKGPRVGPAGMSCAFWQKSIRLRLFISMHAMSFVIRWCARLSMPMHGTNASMVIPGTDDGYLDHRAECLQTFGNPG